MQAGETRADVQKRLTHIVNHLIGLGKIFDKEELNIKVLKCLDRAWQPKVTAITESRDLTTLSTVALFGKHREHKIEMNQLKEQENGERKARSIALKTAVVTEDSEADSSCDSEVETLNMLTRKFSKFLRKRGKEKNQQTKRYTKKTDLNSTNSLALDVESKDISRLNVQI